MGNSRRYTYLEKWNTKHGEQERVVIREDGKFVDSVNLTGLRKVKPVTSR